MKSKITTLITTVVICSSVSFAQAKDKKQEDLELLQKKVEKNLAKFDELDYNDFSNQKWENFKNTHTQDVKVHWPDSHVTEGLDKHIEDLKYMFTYAPDTRVKVHPMRVGQGDWTAVYGIMEGTFSKPMKMQDGKIIQPTGKKFKLPMATFAHWTKDGTFDEEYLLWDNQTYMNQLGLGK
jgi:hypothetical protein